MGWDGTKRDNYLSIYTHWVLNKVFIYLYMQSKFGIQILMVLKFDLKLGSWDLIIKNSDSTFCFNFHSKSNVYQADRRAKHFL